MNSERPILWFTFGRPGRQGALELPCRPGEADCAGQRGVPLPMGAPAATLAVRVILEQNGTAGARVNTWVVGASQRWAEENSESVFSANARSVAVTVDDSVWSSHIGAIKSTMVAAYAECSVPGTPSAHRAVEPVSIESLCSTSWGGLIAEYRRSSYTPILFFRRASDREQCAAMKLSCRLRATPGRENEELIIQDQGAASGKKPTVDRVWGEVFPSLLIRWHPTSLSPDLFGSGAVIPNMRSTYPNCKSPKCISRDGQLPAECEWSGHVVGYLQRFLPLRAGQLRRNTYPSILQDPESMDALAWTWLLDSITHRADRNSKTNLVRSGPHFRPLDFEGIEMKGIAEDKAVLRAREPVLLREIDIPRKQLEPLLLHTYRLAKSLCEPNQRGCPGVERFLSQELPRDPLFLHIEQTADSSPPFLCLIEKLPHNRRSHGPCCPNESEGRRRICLVLQGNVANDILDLGNSTATILARLVSRRMAVAVSELDRLVQSQ